ncbi:MAG: pirin family protein [Proteobacteria bacterium]|nr:pirin family protein [Pseudomonadota bacterium]NOG59251.1 pirin family protein [Pseudomonadota bacterium]
MTLRKIKQQIKGTVTMDGEGVQLTRLIGSSELNMHDPFLLLDEFKSLKPEDYIGGFPDHPHRGFETVTYLIEGKIRHKDNAGHGGVISSGGVQWMTAGKGVIHSEFPEQENGLLWGIQLWINLPASKKMTDPDYQEYDKDSIPVEQRENGALVRVISGTTSQNTKGPITSIENQQNLFIIELEKNAEFKETIASDLNAVLFVFDGEINLFSADGLQTVSQGTLAVLDEGDEIVLSTNNLATRCLLVSAPPLNEPVARGGPFVMNTRAEIMQANHDYETGLF